MTAPVLGRVIPHPRITGTKSERVQAAEALLVAHARKLAEVLGLEDVAGLLGGASNLAASETWEAQR